MTRPHPRRKDPHAVPHLPSTTHRARDRRLCGDRAGAGTGTRRRRGVHRDERERQRRAGLRTGRRRNAHAGGELSHRRCRQRRGRPGLRGRARPRSRLAARRQRGLERRVGLPRARKSARARESRALGRHDAQQRHARPRHRLRAQQRWHRQHHGLQARSPRPRADSRRDAAAVVRDGRRGAGLLHAARRPAGRLGEGRERDRHLSGRPLGPCRSRHRSRLCRRGTVRLRVRQARLTARHGGGRQCADLLPARSVHDDHGLAAERPGRRLLGGLDEQRASRLHGQCGHRLHLRLRGGLERQPLAAHTGRRDGPAGRRHPSAGRGDLA